MAQVIAFTNQKGGVGKTTLAMNFGVRLKIAKARVLLVDMDPQCSLTYVMGVDTPQVTIMDVLERKAHATQAVVRAEECDLICASPRLSVADVTFTMKGKEFLLRDALAPLLPYYDFIVLDSPPTLGVLTINILTAADGVIIPALADIFSLQGIVQLYSTIEAVRKYCNPKLKVMGIILSRHSDRLVVSRELRGAMQQTAEWMGSSIYDGVVRESVAVREAEAKRQSIFRYAWKSQQAQDYERIVAEFLYREGYANK